MEAALRIEQCLAAAIAQAEGPGAPAGLVAAMRHSVFPPGARVRPRLCLAVAKACGEDQPAVSDAAAAAIELLHCASLVHDDLPCFDDALLRRGRPSVHRAYGERVAVLTGDALIVLAFQTLARVGEAAPQRLAALLPVVTRCVGAPGGIVAGQAWECEPQVSLTDYQRAKTGALFAAAAMAGAGAAGADPAAWHGFGERLGEAFQVADDLRDVAASQEEVGKPVHRDQALGRPNAADQLGLAGALQRLEQLLADALALVPACPGEAELRQAVVAEAQRFLPRKLARRAA